MLSDRGELQAGMISIASLTIVVQIFVAVIALLFGICIIIIARPIINECVRRRNEERLLDRGQMSRTDIMMANVMRQSS